MLLRQLSYAIKNQLVASLMGGIGYVELVLNGIRELAEQHYDPLDQ